MKNAPSPMATEASSYMALRSAHVRAIEVLGFGKPAGNSNEGCSEGGFAISEQSSKLRSQ